jgi:hypothetical protein
MIYKAIKYLYYRIYDWNLRAWGESDMPQYNAIIGVSFLIYLNIISLFIAIETLTGNQYFLFLPNGEYYAAATCLLLLLVNYILLVRNGKYLKIAEEFKKENPSQKRKGLVFVWLYVTGSFVILILLAWLTY